MCRRMFPNINIQRNNTKQRGGAAGAARDTYNAARGHATTHKSKAAAAAAARAVQIKASSSTTTELKANLSCISSRLSVPMLFACFQVCCARMPACPPACLLVVVCLCASLTISLKRRRLRREKKYSSCLWLLLFYFIPPVYTYFLFAA